jgi:hypothetical protein
MILSSGGDTVGAGKLEKHVLEKLIAQVVKKFADFYAT